MGQSNARKKIDSEHCCFSASHRTHGGVLGDGIGNSYLVGIPALIHDQLWTTSNGVGLKPTWTRDHFCVLHDDDVVHLLRAAVKREGSQAALAKRYGLIAVL
jgi:hypothetical protein